MQMSQTEFSLPWLEISKERLAERAIAEKVCYEVAKVRSLTSTAGVCETPGKSIHSHGLNFLGVS